MASLNTLYVRSTHGIIKIIQIILGFIICSLLCASMLGGKSCFGDGRLGFGSGLNFVLLLINIVVFILNLINLTIYSLEKIYAIVATILLLIASVLLVWWLIEIEGNVNGRVLAAIILIVIQFVLFLWDVKILQGESANIVH